MATKTKAQEDVPVWDRPRDGDDPDVTDPAAQQVARASEAQPAVEGTIAAFGPAMTSLAQWLTDMAAGSDVDPATAMEDAVARILAKEGDAVQILTEDVPISGKTFLGKPFVLHTFAINEGDFDGSPFYASLSVQAGNPPERRVLNVGGIKVLAKLMKLHELGEWPVTAMLKGSTTKAGHTVLDLVMPE